MKAVKFPDFSFESGSPVKQATKLPTGMSTKALTPKPVVAVLKISTGHIGPFSISLLVQAGDVQLHLSNRQYLLNTLYSFRH